MRVGGDKLNKIVPQENIGAFLQGSALLAEKSGGCYLGKNAALGQGIHLIGVGLYGGIAFRMRENWDISRNLKREEGVVRVCRPGLEG